LASFIVYPEQVCTLCRYSDNSMLPDTRGCAPPTDAT
jgi:hypothetical protein